MPVRNTIKKLIPPASWYFEPLPRESFVIQKHVCRWRFGVSKDSANRVCQLHVIEQLRMLHKLHATYKRILQENILTIWKFPPHFRGKFIWTRARWICSWWWWHNRRKWTEHLLGLSLTRVTWSLVLELEAGKQTTALEVSGKLKLLLRL